MGRVFHEMLLGGLPFHQAGATTTIASMTLDQTTDAIEWIVQMPEAVTITRLGFRVGAISGNAPTHRFSIQGVNASGNPDGTIKGGGSPASGTFNATSLGWSANTWHWITLDNSYAAARGEFLALVIDYSSGTIDASNNIVVINRYTTFDINKFPYVITNNNGTRTRQQGWPSVGWGSSTDVWGYPHHTATTDTVTSTSNPNERGMRFTLPSDVTGTYQVVGVKFSFGVNGASSLNIRLYDGGGAADTTVLQSITYDTDFRIDTVRALSVVYFDETTLSTLTPGNTYRISFAPTAVVNLLMDRLVMDTNADLDAYPGGIECYATHRNGGNWTDINTSRYFLQAIVIDAAVSASSGRPRIIGG